MMGPPNRKIVELICLENVTSYSIRFCGQKIVMKQIVIASESPSNQI